MGRNAAILPEVSSHGKVWCWVIFLFCCQLTKKWAYLLPCEVVYWPGRRCFRFKAVLLFSFLFHSFFGFPLACVHRDRPHLIRPGLNLFSVYIPVLVPFAFEYFVTSSTFYFFVVVCYHLPQTIIVYFAFLFRFFDVICVQSFLASFFYAQPPFGPLEVLAPPEWSSECAF